MANGINVSDKTYSTFSEVSSDFSDVSQSSNVSSSSSDPLSHLKSSSVHATSEWSSFLNLFKANVGVGILAMPLAMSYTGLWLGFVAVPALGGLCIYCMYLLLLSNRELRSRLNCGPLNMEETNKVAFATGPSGVRKFAAPVCTATKIFLVVNQVGFCCVYYVFVSQNIYQAIKTIADVPNFTQFECNMLLIIPFVLVSLPRHLKFITYLSVISTIAQITGICIIMYYCTRDLNNVQDLPAVGQIRNFPLFFGNVIFTFEGIGAVLPIENVMKDASHFGGLNGVLMTCMVLVLILYTAVGFYGYLQYGADVKGSISLNLPSDELLAQSVKIFMALAIFLSFSIQLHVAVEVIMKMIATKETSERTKYIQEYSFRVMTVVLCFAMASAVPNLGLFISLVGAVGGCALSIIFPAVVNLVTFWPDTGLPKMRLTQTLIITSIGIAGFITGTATSISDIASSFEKSNNGTS